MKKSLIAMMLLGGLAFHQAAYANHEVEFTANFTQPTCSLTGPAVVDIGEVNTIYRVDVNFSLTADCEAGAAVALWAETVRGTQDPNSRNGIKMEPLIPVGPNEDVGRLALYQYGLAGTTGVQGDVHPWGDGVTDPSIRFCATDGSAGSFECRLLAFGSAFPNTARGNYSAVVRFSMVYQ